jgi:putative SOS response-associated peptidase YedK
LLISKNVMANWQDMGMCGRFVLDRKATDLTSLFDVDTVGSGIPEPSWNIAPTQLISIVLDSLPRATEAEPYPEPVRRLEAARWGLVPGWATDPKASPPLFNARSEDAADSASFSNAVKKRRAVVPASGYYEWRVVDGGRVPYYVSLPGDELMLFAGLFEWWRNPAATDDAPDRWLLSATIMTRPSAGPLARLHDRMPVFLDADLVEEWLDPQEDAEQDLVDEIVAGGAEVAERVVFHEVSPAVGSADNNGEQLTRAVA